MKTPVKFVSPLDVNQQNELKSLMKNSSKPRIRQRAHGILLSSEGFPIDEIAKICGADRDTISSWIDKWEQFGFESLADKTREESPCILNDSEKQLVIELVKEEPRSIPTILAKVLDITGKSVSEYTIKRYLSAAKLSWKRIRKSMKNKRNQEEFDAAHREIQELKEQHKNEELELWFFDETGFDQQPSVPYAWQPVGETIEVPSEKSKRLNVLGFLTPDNQFESFYFEGTINTDVVTACFDKFARIKTEKNRFVIIDNASIHTSGDFLLKLPTFRKERCGWKKITSLLFRIKSH